MDKLHEENRVLTSDEVKLLVQTCKLMFSMGLGIDPDTCLDIVNAIISKIIEQKHFWSVCRGVVYRIIAANVVTCCAWSGSIQLTTSAYANLFLTLGIQCL